LQYFDVLVDDALGPHKDSQLADAAFVAFLDAMDDVFRPLDSTNPTTRQEPASVKKMLKGGACWSSLKTVLVGWLIDTVRCTINFPPHRLERVHELFDLFRSTSRNSNGTSYSENFAAWPSDLFRGRRRVAKKEWYQLLGELRSMALAISGGMGMSSHLEEALRLGDNSRVKLTKAVDD
jgi:hypothetical protein